MKTLIVEDDLSSRLLLQTLLGRYGECHVAVNGKEAVQAFQIAKGDGRGYDLVCMDIMMPEMDGNAALREIREVEAAAGVKSSAAVKIIMTTALTDMKDVITAFQGLCDAYLFKPIAKAKLVEQLQMLRLVP
jgi:two-component system chemotaxis response regulator CheY